MTSVNDLVTRAALLLLCCAAIDGLDLNCNFYQDLTVGTTYYVYNPEYPYPYRAPRSCMWTLTSGYAVNFTCTTFQLPWSVNCSQDVLAVKVNPSTTHRYCGAGSFSIVSESSSMVVTLDAPQWSVGGRFLCEAVAVKAPQDSVNCRCGWKNPTRIVGGTDTGVNEFPMMAGIVDVVNRNVFCGGTIVSHRYVLTAAHCMDRKEPKLLAILVGDHDLSTASDTNATVLHKVEKFMIHPYYQKKGQLNDIAVIKTDGNIIFNNEVGPACLPFQHMPDTFGGSYVNLLGWGTTDFGGPTSDVLQKVTLSVLTNLECSKNYREITPNQLCTYAKDKDACQMDSGGPVLWQNPTSRRIVLIGIISAGVGCAELGGVNTRVGAYVDWIVSVTSDATYCIIE